MAIVQDLGAWIEAGGDKNRHDILSRAGRLATFTDGDGRVLAAIHPDRPDVGTLGDWVGSREVLRAGERWLAEQGCRGAEGPAMLAPWFPYRANLGPFEQPPMSLEPTERAERWIEAEYRQIARYVSIVTGHDAQIKAGMDRAAALGSRGWRLQGIETGPSSTVTPEAYDAVFETVHELAERAFGDIRGYLPIDASVVAAFYRPLISQLDPRLALIARDPKGDPAAFVLGVPDLAQPSRNWFQILTLAVAPEYRSSGVATWMVAAVHQAARRAGYTAGVHALIRVDGEGLEDTTWYRGDVIRRYALYGRKW